VKCKEKIEQRAGSREQEPVMRDPGEIVPQEKKGNFTPVKCFADLTGHAGQVSDGQKSEVQSLRRMPALS
jgi:hypothetical protein